MHHHPLHPLPLHHTSPHYFRIHYTTFLHITFLTILPRPTGPFPYLFLSAQLGYTSTGFTTISLLSIFLIRFVLITHFGIRLTREPSATLLIRFVSPQLDATQPPDFLVNFASARQARTTDLFSIRRRWRRRKGSASDQLKIAIAITAAVGEVHRFT